MSDQEWSREYVDIWWQAVDDFTDLLEKVPTDQWSTPTDLPGWDVHAIAAHIDHDDVEIGQPAHVHGIMGSFTEQGVVARRDREVDSLIQEIRESATRRHTQLLADPPADPTATADGFAAVMGWSWRTLLRNRPFDVWMHEQDIRRAVGRPGNLDTAAAAHTVRVFADAFGYAVGKRVAPPPGTTVVLEVRGAHPVHLAVEVNEAGRAVTVPDDPDSPTVRLEMGTETFAILGGGRRSPDRLEIRMVGDEDLGRRVLAAMAVTP